MKSTATPKIVFETDDFLVIDKPAYLHSVTQKDSVNSLEAWLAQERPEHLKLKESGLVQRLDFETSGCILAAKTPESRDRLWGERNQIEKFYWVLTEKDPGTNSFDFYFYSRYRGSQKMSVEKNGKAGERGKCQWRLLHKATRGSREVNLFEVELMGGGKRHQIRAGFAKLGCPLLGDELYGSEAKEDFLGLHSHELRVEGHRVICAPPEAWRSHFPLLFT